MSATRASDVLATMEANGSRRWLRPKLAHGRYLTGRTIVGCVLIFFFVAMPFVRIGGHAGLRIDIPARKVFALGAAFQATDSVALMLFLISAFTTVVLATALVGRAWCGWTCPQTVYLELVFRPLQRLFEGRGYATGKPGLGSRFALLAVYVVLSLTLGNVFVAYFTGTEALGQAIFESPARAPAAFAAMIITSVLVFADFAWFREQMCSVACPYARLQSALVDADSVVVAYDAARGEPRGKPREGRGDCIDCAACVRVCPTGIDIRHGAQLECIQCAQCADACDLVMLKLGRQLNLVGYQPRPLKRLVRPRVLLYAAVITASATSLALVIRGRAPYEVTLLRTGGLPYSVLPDGTVANPFRLKLENRGDTALDFTVTVEEDTAKLISEQSVLTLAPGATRTLNLVVSVPADQLVNGEATRHLAVGSSAGRREIDAKLLGPTRQEVRP